MLVAFMNIPTSAFTLSLFLLLDFFPVPVVQVGDTQLGVQAGFWVAGPGQGPVEFLSPHRCTVGRTDGHHAEMLLPLWGAGKCSQHSCSGDCLCPDGCVLLCHLGVDQSCINLCNSTHTCIRYAHVLGMVMFLWVLWKVLLGQCLKTFLLQKVPPKVRCFIPAPLKHNPPSCHQAPVISFFLPSE